MAFNSAINEDLGYNGFPVSLSYFAAAPDVSLISDANYSVIFKSLLKKNSVTKEKNLTDLEAVLKDPSLECDDTLITCWIQLYPKLALDNSRSVRSLAHQVQATLLRKVGGKDFSKYLKSSIPLWLQAIYDSDRSLASSTYADLIDCFQNDKERVDSKIWLVFFDQIVNYIHTVILVELHDSLSDQRYVKESDSFAKYDRALNGALMMICKLIDLINTQGEMVKSETSNNKLQEVLGLEKLWDNLACSSGETFNAPLLNTFLTLIKKLFALDKEQRPSEFTTRIGDIKGIYKSVSKRFIKNVKLKGDASKSVNVIYCNNILQLWDTLSALTSFSIQNQETKKLLKIKKNFWELGGSKSYSRFKDYLRLGPCNSNPIYYNIVRSFFSLLAEVPFEFDEKFSFVDFSKGKDASFVVETLLSHLQKLQGFSFKKSFIDCVFHIIGLFNTDNKAHLMQSSFIHIVDALPARSARRDDAASKAECLKSLSASVKLIDFKLINSKIADHLPSRDPLCIEDYQFSSSYEDMVSFYVEALEKRQAEDFLDSLLLVIQSVYDDDLLTRAFKILILCVKHGYSHEFKEWIPLLPSYFSPTFYEWPLSLLKLVLKDGPLWLNVSALLDDIFTKLSVDVPRALPVFFITLQETGRDSDLKSSEAENYLVKLSQNDHRTDEENLVVSKHISNTTILRNLLHSKDVQSDPSKLISTLTNSGFSIDKIDDMKAHWINAINHSLKSFNIEQASLFLNGFKNKQFIKNVFGAYITQEDASLQTLSSYIKENPDLIPFDELWKNLNDAINSVDLDTIAVANPLAQNVHLISITNDRTDLHYSAVRIARFLEKYAEAETVDEWTFSLLEIGAVVAEYLKDYVFLSHIKTDTEEISALQSSLSNKLATELHSTAVSKNLFSNPETVSGFRSRLFLEIGGEHPTMKQLYSARCLVESFGQAFESMSLNAFEALEIPFARIIKEPLKLATILCSSGKFIGNSKHFDRTRNFVFAEILGVTDASAILSKGKDLLTISINFLRLDNIAYEVLPGSKLGLVVNHLSGWLESEVAFDDEFLPVRCLLSVFFNDLINRDPENVSDKTIETAFDLCSNNISTCEVSTGAVELRYHTIRLCNTLTKHFETSQNWKENLKSITSELLDLMSNEHIEKKDSKNSCQAILMINEHLRRFLLKTETSKDLIQEKSDKLYGILQNSRFVDLQRVASSFLEGHVLRSQEDFVVEYQLRKSNLGDSDENGLKAELPGQLLKILEASEYDWDEVVESGNYEVVFRYLWAWILIFDHFKDTTHSIKTDYINQLKADGKIKKLFDDLLDHIEFTNSSFLKTLVSGNEKTQKVNPENNLISQYRISQGCVGETLQYEVRFLFVHLFFLSLHHFGSFAQHWYNEIRDLQLKQQVEKFTIRLISPILISKMLNEVERVKNRLTDKDENLTIKVNKVTNEVRTIYIIDEQKMEMVVKIPEAFPLSSVEVQGPLRLGVKENQWKAWLLASQRVVSLTNGSIIDSVELFNRNVNLHFSGFEECAICYSILHQDHSLPSKTCPTCLNKFHAACLYKWFKSSGSSTCPLCRSAFNFNKA